MLDSKHTAIEWLKTRAVLYCGHSASTTVTKILSWVFLPLSFTKQGGVTGTHFSTSATAGGLGYTCRLAIHHSGPSENCRLSAPTANPPRTILPRPLLKESQSVAPLATRTVPVRLADGAGAASETLHTCRKKTCHLSSNGRTHSSFHHNPCTISKTSLSTGPLSMREN